MSPTEDEARLLDSSTEFASTHPPLSPLKINQPYTRPRSNPLNLHAGSHRISAELTGPPSPSVSSGSGLIPDLGTNPASSLWPQVERKSYLRHSSTLSSFTSSGSKPNSGADAEEHVDLPPISPSRKYVPFEPLPSVIPQRPRSPSPPVPPTLLTSPTLPQRTGSGRNRLVLRPATVNWGGFDSGFPARPPDQNKRNNKQIVWKTIQKAGVPVYLDTPGFDGESKSPHLHTQVFNNPLCSVHALPFRIRHILLSHCSFGGIFRYRCILSPLCCGAKVIKERSVGISGHPGEKT